MKRLSLRQLGCLVVASWGLAASASWADPVSTVQLLRVSGCGGLLPAFEPLRHNGQLDRAAALWATGGTPAAAAARSGYQTGLAVGLRLSGPDDMILQAMRRAHCRDLDDQALRDIGTFRSGAQTWVVMAAPGDAAASPVTTFAYATAPAPGPASTSATRVLQLVNEVRASGTRCGGRAFGAAPPLQLSGTLASVAAEHASDMARHDYFEHEDRNGRSPADRVRAAGYREKLVGENIAYGPESAEEVVAGWLHSTGHCENIMDPRFQEMGLALAPGQGSRRGLYWDQVLSEPAQP